MSVVIETTIGDITVDLFVKERPKTCLNFIKLCKLKYYNYNLFHTIEQGFIAQTGDPTGDGDKGESVWGVIEGPKKKFFESEQMPKILHSEAGLLSMVSTGENFIGSQFFFTLGSELSSLDGFHCVIGEVVEGHEIVRMLNEAIVDDKHRPYKDIRITHTVVLEDPYADPRGFRQPSRSPSPTPERLRNGRIAADEDIDDTQGKTEAEIQEMLQDREAKARATILEIVGDIPDADVAPPENVLFVCKLNPVTTDDDLQIIFSRFGRIKTCEVIRDKVTGDSLQYSFIEFEEQKSCEDAYFKMDNVLIDDRRIHVDFSQSVSKIKWRGKGNYTVDNDFDGTKPEKSFKKGNREFQGNRRSRSPRRDDRPRFDNRNNQRRFDDRRGGDMGQERRFDDRRNDGRRDVRRFEDRRLDNRRNDDRRNDDRRQDNRRKDERRVDGRRNFDSRYRSRSPRRQSPPRKNRQSPQRRSRSRDRRGGKPSTERAKPSPERRKTSPERRKASPERRKASPERRKPSPDHRKASSKPKPSKRKSSSSSRSSDSSPERKKPKKSSSKKSKKRDTSSSSSSSSSSSDHKKKHRR